MYERGLTFANLTAANGEGFLTKFLTGDGQKIEDWCGNVRRSGAKANSALLRGKSCFCEGGTRCENAHVVDFTHLAPDRVEATLQVRPEHKQPWEIVHGGAVMTLADTVSGAGAYMNLGQDQETVTVELKINLIGAVRQGVIRAQALPLHRGRSTSIWEARITDETGKLVAVSLSTHLVLERTQ